MHSEAFASLITRAHVRHPLAAEFAQTLACSSILSRIDYCNALLRSECRTMQLGWCCKYQDDPTPSQAAASQAALFVEQRIIYNNNDLFIY